MADDDFRRRRLGDATKARIADLASGWDTPNPDAEPAPEPLQDPAPRKKQRTIPPPAPGSPERLAYEAKIVATTADREDATNELPPRPPTGAYPVIRSDEDDPRATQNSAPPPPPRAKAATGQVPVAGRPRTPTGQVPLAAGRPRTTTGQVPLAADRPRTTTGQVPLAADRPRTTTGQLPLAGDRPRTPTGQVPLAGDRPRTPTGQAAVVAERSRTPTGNVPSAGGRPRTPAGQQPGARSDDPRATQSGPPRRTPGQPLDDRPRSSTGQVPVAGDRPRPPTGQAPIAESRTATGQQPGARSDDPRATQSGPPPPPPPRPKAATGQQPAIARTSTGPQSASSDRTQVTPGPNSAASQSGNDSRSTAGDRGRVPTGQQAPVGRTPSGSPSTERSDRTQITSGPPPGASHSSDGSRSTGGDRGRAPTGQQPSVGRTPTGQQGSVGRTPSGSPSTERSDRTQITSGPPPGASHSSDGSRSTGGDRGRVPTGQQPSVGRTPTGQQPVAARAHVPTGRHVIISDRARTGTGQHPVISERPGAGQSTPGRDSSSTGRHAVIAERARTATGELPVVVPPLFGRSKPVTVPPPPPGSSASSPSIPPLPARDTEPVRRVDPTPTPSPDTEPVVRVDETPLPSAHGRGKPISYPPPPTPDTEPVPRFDLPLVPAASERSKPVSAPPLPDRSKPVSAPPPLPDRSKPTAVARSSPSAPPPVGDRDDRISIGSLDWSVPRAGTAGERADETGAGSNERSKAPSSPPPTAIPVPPLVSSSSVLARAEEAAKNDGQGAGRQFPRAGFEGPSDPFATENRPSVPEMRPFASEQRTFSTENRTPPVIVDASLVADGAPLAAARAAASAPAKQTVPTGEFDSSSRTVNEHTTGKRDAAEALLRIPDTVTPVEELLEDDDEGTPAPVRTPAQRGTAPIASTFERGDATQNAPPDATQIEQMHPKHPTGGTLRASAALRRKRGLWGDVRYVFTAVFGVRQSRRELAELEHRQSVRQTSRRRHLITLGRTAAVMDTFDHEAIGKAREQLALIEDERSKHAGAVAASDAELERVRRDRENTNKQHAIAVSETDAELTDLAKKLEPVEKEAQAARKRASDLRDELRRIEKQITDTEAKLVSVRAEKTDKAAIQADIATFRANKEAVMRDEPVIAAELDALNPRIAAMEATRTALEKKKAEIQKAEQDDQKRTMELLEAIGAKRKVVERAAADAETARDNALFDLGERLYIDRPAELFAQVAPIERIDLELGEDERRAMELKEILSNIDRWKFSRGLAMIILALGVIGSIAWLVLASV